MAFLQLLPWCLVAADCRHFLREHWRAGGGRHFEEVREGGIIQTKHGIGEISTPNAPIVFLKFDLLFFVRSCKFS
jgi:hypothetical protein